MTALLKSLEIRQAVLNDALRVSQIHVESWKHAYRGLIPDSILDNLSIENRMKHWANAIESGDPYLLVAEKDSVIAGWVAFGPSRDEGASAKTGEIEAIYVHPQYWSQGIGKRLIAAAIDVLSSEQFSRVTLWVLSGNSRAVQFYGLQGFTLDAHPPKISERGGQKIEEVRYGRGIRAAAAKNCCTL